ncbi:MULTISPECIES: hypothetical protein [Brucella]|uniref:hypothetical protein n=1 Tax=Brucella TaxID=234 RepID=UPI000A807790|nr:hypothetical protein [Brucella intermedia]
MAIILDDNTDIDTFFGGNSGANSRAAKNREPSEKPREQELPSVGQKAARPPVDSTSSREFPASRNRTAHLARSGGSSCADRENYRNGNRTRQACGTPS